MNTATAVSAPTTALVSPSPSSSPPSSAPREIVPVSQPTPLLPTPASRTFRHVHPVLLLGYFCLRFRSLVAAPVDALAVDVLPVALVQAAYAIVCLPAAQTPSTSRARPKVPRPAPPLPPGKRRAGASSSSSSPAAAAAGDTGVGSISVRVSTAFLSLLLTALLAAPALHVLLVLFGAPLTTHHAQTALCATHMALLAAFPLFYTKGVDRRMWWEVMGVMLPADEVWGATVGCALGAWLGAVPIPLDWDRDWQTWPITIVAGAYVGYVLGKVAGGYVLRGRRINFD